MYQEFTKTDSAANSSEVLAENNRKSGMESRDHRLLSVAEVKNGASPKSHTSRENVIFKMFLLIPLLSLFMSISSYAQILTPQKNSKGKWGYVNETGKVIIKQKYDEAREFSEGLAVVKVSKSYSNVVLHKFGVIDKTGKVVIPLEYDKIDDFSEGLAKVMKKGRWGFIDRTGKEIIPIQCGEIGDFSEGLVRAKPYNLSSWGFYDKTGNLIVDFAYKQVDDFSEGLARVMRGGYSDRWGFIDKTGKVVFPLEFGNATNFSNGYAGVEVRLESGTWLWVIMDKRGEILPVEYDKNKVMKLVSDPVLMQNELQRIKETEQKEIQRKQVEEKEKQRKQEEEEMLIEEAEAVLDNDYYSDDCHPVEVLEELRKKLEKLENELSADFNNMEKKTYLLQLQTGLSNAIRTQIMTKKHGVVTAKKIMTGEYEIGMPKAIVEEIMGVNKLYYKKSISTYAGKQSEIWEFDYNAADLQAFTLQVKNNLKAKCPTFVFRDGKLTDIIR